MEDTNIKKIVETVIENIENKTTSPEAVLFGVWQEITGNNNSEVETLKEGVLTVKVKNSTVLFKLTFQKKKIINAVNNIFGKEIVKNLKLKI